VGIVGLVGGCMDMARGERVDRYRKRSDGFFFFDK
jgi:hypothetical protein